MTSFLGIVRLTLKTAIRSNIFQLLLLLLVFCIVFIPTTIAGDGTAQGYIQVSLKYSLAAIGFVLSLSSVWLGCFMMTRDTETYQLHMVVTKPVSRTVIWLGKWFGIIVIHLILLLISALIIYFIVQYQFHRQNFSEKERARIENEVMVARRVYYPEMPDINTIAQRVMRERIEFNKKAGKTIDESPAGLEKLLADVKREVISSYGQIPYGGMREWVYAGLPTDLKKPLFLRYRMYVNKIGTENQRLTRGLWFAGYPVSANKDEKPAKNVFEQKKLTEQSYQMAPVQLTAMPEQIMSGEFHEKILNPEFIAPDGKMVIGFRNDDPGRAALFFQPSDGPKLLIGASSFSDNYFRAVLVVFIQLMVMAGLGCAAGSVLSMPTAIFLVISYLLFGSFAVSLSGTSYFGGTADYVGYYLGNILLWVVIPMQAFDISSYVSGGELIEFSLMGSMFFKYFILRAIPLFLLGIWLYNRREIGLVIRK